MVGALMYMASLDAPGAPSLLAVGFRITDDATEPWTRRFNLFKARDEASVVAGIRTMSAALLGTGAHRAVTLVGNPRVVVVGAISSGDGTLQNASPVWRLGEAVAQAKAWEWRPDLLRKTPHRTLHTMYNAGERDAEVAGRYRGATVGGASGVFMIVDDFCTRGTTAAEISRALREANPGWRVMGMALAKTERRGYWGAALSNGHVPDDLDRIWQGR
jgi:hypothetical protein